MDKLIDPNQKVISFDSNDHYLPPDLIPQAFDLLIKHQFVEELSLYRQPKLNQPYLVKLLVNVIQSNPRIKILRLDDNLIVVEGAQILAEMIENNTTLEQFLTYNQRFGNQGTVILAQALEKNQTIRKFSLGLDKLTDQSGYALAKMLRINQSLNSFKIAYCKFSVKCLTEIIETLSNHRLREFITYNSDSTSRTNRPDYFEYYLKLNKILEDNLTLTTLQDNQLSIKLGSSTTSMQTHHNCPTRPLKESIFTRVRRNQRLFKFSEVILPLFEGLRSIFQQNTLLYLKLSQYLLDDYHPLDQLYQAKHLNSLFVDRMKN